MNPFTIPLYIVGISTGVIAALIPGSIKYPKTIKVTVIIIGTLVCWVLQIHFVNWAYNHPFNPNDGGAKAFVSLFGGAANLIWPILPTFGLVDLLKRLVSKKLSRSQVLSSK